MKSLMNVSEATAIGLHAMTLMVNEDAPVSAFYIAEKLGVSKHHLSKVLRDLVMAELLSSIKGPSGRFFLTESQQETTFMQIFEAIEGKVEMYDCIFGRQPCSKRTCILGSLLCNLNTEFSTYFNNTKIINFKEK